MAFAIEEASTRGGELVAIHSWNMGQFVASWAAVPVAVDWTAVIAAERATFTKSMTTWRTKYPDVDVVLALGTRTSTEGPGGGEYRRRHARGWRPRSRRHNRPVARVREPKPAAREQLPGGRRPTPGWTMSADTFKTHLDRFRGIHCYRLSDGIRPLSRLKGAHGCPRSSWTATWAALATADGARGPQHDGPLSCQRLRIWRNTYGNIPPCRK